MNPLVAFPARRFDPYGDREAPEPVRAAVRSSSHIGTCHRCDRSAIIAAIYLVNEENEPLCADCTAALGPGLALGMRALNALEYAVRRPGAEPPRQLIHEWETAKQSAGRLAEQLLDSAVQLLAAELRMTGLALP
jgi:hypothetical protein